MPEERAFTRRQAGVNPIALELERLAEQQALRTLGTPRAPLNSPIPSADDADEPRNALGQTQGEERDADAAAAFSRLGQILTPEEPQAFPHSFGFRPRERRAQRRL